MNRRWIVTLGFIILAVAGFQSWLIAQESKSSGSTTTTNHADKNAPLKQFMMDYESAFNKGDASKLASMWAADATYFDRVTNERREGRDKLAKDIETFLKTNPKAQMNIKANHIRWIKGDVAQVDATVTVMTADGASTSNQLMAVIVKDNNVWSIVSAEEYELATPKTSADALRDLEWLVGEWRDDVAGVKVKTNVRWSRQNAFLIRSYNVEFGEGDVHEGTQVIGWDPRQEQIRSWTFDSDGSFSEETWSKSGNEWTMRSTRTMSDGRLATATHILTPVDANSFTVKIIGREVDGQILPSTDPIKIVRVTESK